MARVVEKATKKMREIMISRGHVEGQNMELLAKFYILLTVIFISYTILDIFNLEAHQLEEKIFRFKNINMLICGLAYPLVDKDTYSLISHAEDQGNHDDSSYHSESWTILDRKMDKELDLMNKVLYSVVVSSCVTLTFGPLVAATLKYYPQILTGSLHEIKVTELTLPINFLYPEDYANLATYIFLYALQTLYMYLFAGYMYCTLTSGLMAMKTTIHDMKVLCLTVKEWDLDQNGFGRQIQSYGVSNLSAEFTTDTKLLKSTLVNVIKIHELICRKASNLNKNLEIMYTILNNTICFQICVCLYSAAKMEDFVLKIEHILLVLPMASILFLYCFSAQQLLNEGENLRTALWESAFVDKPKWYKSSFFMIMIRNTKDLEIKPFGFYVLNLKTFATVMNAAYSYFNMLNSLNKRI